MTLTLSQQIKVSDDVLVQEVGGEAVLLNLASQRYFGLDAIGTRIWALLGQRTPLAGIVETIRSEYDVEPSRAEADLLALVGELRDMGLVETVAEPS